MEWNALRQTPLFDTTLRRVLSMFGLVSAICSSSHNSSNNDDQKRCMSSPVTLQRRIRTCNFSRILYKDPANGGAVVHIRTTASFIGASVRRLKPVDWSLYTTYVNCVHSSCFWRIISRTLGRLRIEMKITNIIEMNGLDEYLWINLGPNLLLSCLDCIWTSKKHSWKR